MIFGLLKGASTAKSLLGGKKDGADKKVKSDKLLAGKPSESGGGAGGSVPTASAIVVRSSSAIVPVKKVSYKTKTEKKRVTGTPLERISKRLDGLVSSTGVLVKALKTNYENQAAQDKADQTAAKKIKQKVREGKAEAKEEVKSDKKIGKMFSKGSSLFGGIFDSLKSIIFATLVMEGIRVLSDPKKSKAILKFLEDNVFNIMIGATAIAGGLAIATVIGVAVSIAPIVVGVIAVVKGLALLVAGAVVGSGPAGWLLASLAIANLYVRSDVDRRRRQMIIEKMAKENITPQVAIEKTKKRLAEEESKFFKDQGKIDLIKRDLEFLEELSKNFKKPEPEAPKPVVKPTETKIPGVSLGERAGYSASRGRDHRGRDIAAPSGTPLIAQTDAEITAAGFETNYGNYVVFVDSNGIEHFYGHMKSPSRYKVGDKVPAGTEIGQVGSTGRSSGPHLHWEVSPIKDEVGFKRSKLYDPIDDYGYSMYSPFAPGNPATKTPDDAEAVSRQASYEKPVQYAFNPVGPSVIPTAGGAKPAPAPVLAASSSGVDKYYKFQYLGILYKTG